MNMYDRTKVLAKLGWKYWDAPCGREYYSPAKVKAHPRSYKRYGSSTLEEAKEAVNLATVEGVKDE